MAPLIVMVAGWILFRLLGAAGVLGAASSWSGALRFALAVMFVFTALAHFLPRTRPDLVRMVPSAFPAPGHLVTVTGIFELLGAAGLVLPALTRASAYALMLLLVALFPANIHAARKNLPVAGRPATPLSFRLPLQLFWIGALWWVTRSAG
jgi:uncharacterized membrane protein